MATYLVTHRARIWTRVVCPESLQVSMVFCQLLGGLERVRKAHVLRLPHSHSGLYSHLLYRFRFRCCTSKDYQACPRDAMVFSNLTMRPCTSTTIPLSWPLRALIYDILFSYSITKSYTSSGPLSLELFIWPLFFLLIPFCSWSNGCPNGQLKLFFFITFNSLHPSFSSHTSSANSLVLNQLHDSVSPHLCLIGVQNTAWKKMMEVCRLLGELSQNLVDPTAVGPQYHTE